MSHHLKNETMLVEITKDYWKVIQMEFENLKGIKTSNINDLTEFVRNKLIENHLIAKQTSILLQPHHNIIAQGRQLTHYIITCSSYQQKKFFLKVLKDNDATPLCEKFISQSNNNLGEINCPFIVVPQFNYLGTEYYITTFIDGDSVDSLIQAKNVDIDDLKHISYEVKKCIQNLSQITAPEFSLGCKFVGNDFRNIFESRLSKRLSHPIVANYDSKLITTAQNNCKEIIGSSQFSVPSLLHMDIKPANIVYNPTTRTVTLIDYEQSRFGDIDYGWIQVLLSGYNIFGQEYNNHMYPYIIEDQITMGQAFTQPKFICYLFYQSLCNLIFYYDRKRVCPDAMKAIFEKALNNLQ